MHASEQACEDAIHDALWKHRQERLVKDRHYRDGIITGMTKLAEIVYGKDRGHAIWQRAWQRYSDEWHAKYDKPSE